MERRGLETVNVLSRCLSLPAVHSNPSLSELRQLASHEEKTTIYGSAGFVSSVRSRSASHTYVIQDDIRLGVRQQGISRVEAAELAGEVVSYLRNQPLVQVDRCMGLDPRCRFNCRLLVTAPYARLAYMWHKMLFPPSAGDPDLLSVYVPEWPERKIICDPVEGVTYILGTDYFGEAKKSFLRMAMFKVKQEGRLGFHAGSKQLRILKDGELSPSGFVVFGLSGTGKTTLTTHDHFLSGPEGVIIKQDDVVVMDASGYCYGTENGFFIKTEGLEPGQAVLYGAAQDPEAVFENVIIDDQGNLRFDDHSLTSNGRAVIPREKIAFTQGHIDLDMAHNLVFITRRKDILPPLAKLNPEQAALYFMLGESIETSAGDPTKAGQSKREVGTNPFIIGPEEEEGHLLLDILRRNPSIECYLLNTGQVADEDITVKLSTKLMAELARGTVEWKSDPDWGYLVPAEIPGVDIERYEPSRYYGPSEYRDRIEALRRERLAWLSQFPGLREEIRAALDATG